jgi:AcrR family transcriptional regulator
VTRSERTRAALQEAALTLFQRQGFDGTTVAEIAAAAGVSHMTFFRHFPTKEAVLLDDPYDPVIAELVAAQPADLTAVQRASSGLLAAWRAVDAPTDAVTRTRVRLVAGHPGLRAAAIANNARTEHAIVEALIATGVDRPAAVAAAGACLGAITATLFDWGAKPHAGELGVRVVAALEQLAGEPR